MEVIKMDLPEELLQEIVMNMPLKDVLKQRDVSKEWRNRIDSLWCRLLDRDFNINKKDNCYKEYKRNFILKTYLTFEDNKVKGKNKELFYDIVKDIGFKNYDGLWYFVPKISKLINKPYITLFEISNIQTRLPDDYDRIFNHISNLSNQKIQPKWLNPKKEFTTKALVMKDDVYKELYDRALDINRTL